MGTQLQDLPVTINPEAGGFGSDPDGCFKRHDAPGLLKRCAAKTDAWTGCDDVNDGSPNKASNPLGAAIQDNAADTNGDRWTVNYPEKSSKDSPVNKLKLKCTRFFSKVGLDDTQVYHETKTRSKFSGREGQTRTIRSMRQPFLLTGRS